MKPIPLPPPRICDLTTHPLSNLEAIATAYSAEVATSPRGMETLNEANRFPAWYSWSLIPLFGVVNKEAFFYATLASLLLTLNIFILSFYN
jgi:hypothetical protein